MKRLSFLMFFIFIFFLTVNVMAQDSTTLSGTSPRSVISFAETVHDFGSVKGDTTLIYRFAFRNLGDDTLRIYRLKSG